MTERKTFISRAVDALIESRMRQANYQVAMYRDAFGTDKPSKGL